MVKLDLKIGFRTTWTNAPHRATTKSAAENGHKAIMVKDLGVISRLAYLQMIIMIHAFKANNAIGVRRVLELKKLNRIKL